MWADCYANLQSRAVRCPRTCLDWPQNGTTAVVPDPDNAPRSPHARFFFLSLYFSSVLSLFFISVLSTFCSILLPHIMLILQSSCFSFFVSECLFQCVQLPFSICLPSPCHCFLLCILVVFSPKRKDFCVTFRKNKGHFACLRA